MKYCRNTTESHPIGISYPACIEDINAHIQGEGYIGAMPLFVNNETVIDLDSAEINVAAVQQRQLNQSMDMTVGLIDRKGIIREMLLVEFKFNMANPNNLRQDDLIGKVNGSSLILGQAIAIHHFYIFIFQSHLVEQAKNRLSRMNPAIPNVYAAMDINTLKIIYFDSCP